VNGKAWAVVVANFRRLQEIANVAAETLLEGSSSLFPAPLAHTICTFLKEITETASSFRHRFTGDMGAGPRPGDEVPSFGARFGEAIEAAVRSLLVAVQNLQSIQAASDPLLLPDGKGEEEHVKDGAKSQPEHESSSAGLRRHEDSKCDLVEFHNYLCKGLVEAFNLKNMRDNLKAAIALLFSQRAHAVAPHGEEPEEDRVALALLAQLHPLLRQYHALVGSSSLVPPLLPLSSWVILINVRG